MKATVGRGLAALIAWVPFAAPCVPMPAAPEKPTAFAFGIDLALEDEAGLYELPIPRAAYEGVVRADLGDVRVFNAAREIVPHTFRPRVTVTALEPALVELPIFPIRTDAPAGIEGVDLRVEQSGDRTVIALRTPEGGSGTAPRLAGYVADARSIEAPVRAVEIALPVDAADVLARVTIEGSDDLRTWTMLASDAPVVRLTAGTSRLEQSRIETTPRRFAYLRLSWPAGAPALELESLRALPGMASQPAAREWKELRAVPLRGVAGRYEVDLAGRYPVDRLSFVLPQPNTIAAITLYSRTRLNDPWGFVTGATVYRVTDAGGEVRSEDVVVGTHGDRYWRFDVDARGGGFGRGELSVRVGWVPHRLVFVARGRPPFLLAYGSRAVAPFAFPIATVVPGYTPETPSGRVSIGVARGDESYVLAGERVTVERMDWKRALLWVSLVAGVALLGWMALRLARQMSRTSP